MKQLEQNIIAWAKDKGIAVKGNDIKQFLKTVSEAGEVADALLKNDQEGVKDGIGDMVVTLIILAHNRGLDLKTCLSHAWEEIKDRTGTTKDGVFVKD